MMSDHLFYAHSYSRRLETLLHDADYNNHERALNVGADVLAGSLSMSMKVHVPPLAKPHKPATTKPTKPVSSLPTTSNGTDSSLTLDSFNWSGVINLNGTDTAVAINVTNVTFITNATMTTINASSIAASANTSLAVNAATAEAVKDSLLNNGISISAAVAGTALTLLGCLAVVLVRRRRRASMSSKISVGSVDTSEGAESMSLPIVLAPMDMSKV
jgi:hypothetical protein